MKTLIVWLLLAASCLGQINVPAESEPYKLLVATCDLKPGPNVDLHASWRASSDKVSFAKANDSTLYLTATPGEHWLEVTGLRQEFQEKVVLVPGPKWPDDPKDLKRETIKVYSPATIINHRAAFKVHGDVPGPVDDPLVPKVSAVVYVFEKDETAVPNPVKAALNTLSRQGIIATLFEDDITDGTGQIPEQYKVALEAARKNGLPTLVVLSGGVVARTVKAPTTEAQVLEAAK